MRLPARGEVAQAGRGAPETAAAGRRQQRHVVEEVEAQTAEQDGLAGGDAGEVEVGRVGGRDMAEAVAVGVRGQALLCPVGHGRQMALGQDHGGQVREDAAVVEYEDLVAVGRLVEAGRACPVRQDP